jgi:hypothetical protein
VGRLEHFAQGQGHLGKKVAWAHPMSPALCKNQRRKVNIGKNVDLLVIQRYKYVKDRNQQIQKGVPSHARLGRHVPSA